MNHFDSREWKGFKIYANNWNLKLAEQARCIIGVLLRSSFSVLDETLARLELLSIIRFS